MNTKTKIEAEVEARNLCNAEANRLFPILVSHFKKFTGQKILKVDNSLMGKAYIAVPSTPSVHIYRGNSDYDIYYCIRFTVEHERGLVQAEQYISIGKLDNKVLTTTYAQEPLRTDYTVQHVLDARKAVSDAREALSVATRNLHPFGEY